MLDLTLADYTNIGIGLAVGYMAFQNRRDQIKAQAAREKNEAAILAAKIAVEDAAKKAVEVAEAQKVEAEKVKEELVKTSAVNDKKLDTIHNLVNSDMGKVLSKNATAMDRIAILEHTAENIAAAKEAHSLLEAHQAKQHQVDVKEETGFEASPT